MTSLSKVIAVDETKCVNCHACISACPVKFCNDGSGDIVAVNSDMCIACGKCITACTHKARSFIDDFSKFIDDIIIGEKIIAISAPAVAAGFPDQYLNLNSWLKELGVEAVFDVSFGAELTTKSYVEYIKEEKPKTVIAQPCAAIVTYIELYQPELLKYLAPADSPMLHTIKMVHEFYPQYKNHKVAIISPCNAKKREFEETGLGDYNIAHVSIDNFLKENNVNLRDYPKTDFDNPSAERAVLFSSPGGLLETAKRWIPEIEDNIRKIEGTPLVYEYLKTLPKMIDKGMSPLLIDCLSCEFGCNSGPLTVTKDKPQDEIEYWIRKRSKELKKKYLDENGNNEKLSKQKIEEVLDNYWKEDLYERTYVNRWENVKLSYPTKTELKNIYATMHKYVDDDIKNCTACGYNSCEGMATAIKNGLNKPGNCHYYIKQEGEIAIDETEKSKQKFVTILDTAIDGFVEIGKNEVILDANPAMKKMLKKNDIIGRRLFDFIDDKDTEILTNQIKDRKAGKTASYELEFIQSEGEKIYCLISATPKYDFATQNITGSYAMVSNITKIKQAEIKLKNVNENLEQRVKDRTLKLAEAFEKIQQRNEEMHQQQEEILAQRDALEESEEKTKKQNKDITDSIEYARRIQMALLKTEKLLDITDIFVLFKPKDIVSGDFYVVKKIFNYSIIIAADSTGHGVPGAFMSLLGVSLLNEIIAKNYRKIRRTGFSASKILDDLRKNIINILQQKNEKIQNRDGIDIVICIIDNDLQQLQYAGAYNPLIFIRNNKLTEIKADKMPVGIHTLMRNPKDFTNNTINLEINDTFYIFSDGYQDQFGSNSGRKFMRKTLKDLLLEINKKPMIEQKEILKERLEIHKGNTTQTDDIVVIGFRY